MGATDWMSLASWLLRALALLLAAWGTSLIWRGLFRAGDPTLRRCPKCGEDMRTVAGLACPHCEHAAKKERQLHPVRSAWFWIALGVALLPVAVVIEMIVRPVALLQDEVPSRPSWWNVGAALVALIGVAFALAAWWGDRSKGRARCPNCWYDMSGVSGLLCPECGHEAGRRSRLYRTRRRPRVAVLGVLALVFAFGLFKTPGVQRNGWRSLVPSSVLIVGLEWVPTDSLFAPGGRGWGPRQGTLAFRASEEELWGWQERWLEARLRSAILDARSLERIAAYQQLYVSFVWEPEGSAYIEPALGRVLDGLHSSDPSEAKAARQAFWLSWGRVEDAETRRMLTERAGEITDFVLTDGSGSFLRCGAWALTWTADPINDALPAIRLLYENNAQYPYVLSRAVSELSEREPGVVEELLRMSRSSDAGTRRFAAWLLARVQRPLEDRVELIIAQLEDESEEVRYVAAQAAAEMMYRGTELDPMRDDLTRALRRRIEAGGPETMECLRGLARGRQIETGDLRTIAALLEESVADWEVLEALAELPREDVEPLIPALQELAALRDPTDVFSRGAPATAASLLVKLDAEVPPPADPELDGGP